MYRNLRRPVSSGLLLLCSIMLLAGCSEAERVAECEAKIEPTLLRIALAASDGEKAKYRECVKAIRGFSALRWCASAYLPTEQLMASCMEERGYVRRGDSLTCIAPDGVYDANCFRSAQSSRLLSFLPDR